MFIVIVGCKAAILICLESHSLVIFTLNHELLLMLVLRSVSACFTFIVMFALGGCVHQIIVIDNKILMHGNRVIFMVVNFVTLLASCVLLHLRVIERLLLGHQSTISRQILTFLHMVSEHLVLVFHYFHQRIILVVFLTKVVILILLVFYFF